MQNSTWIDNFWLDDISVVSVALKTINSFFDGKFQKAEKSSFYSGRQQNSGFRAADFRGVWYRSRFRNSDRKRSRKFFAPHKDSEGIISRFIVQNFEKVKTRNYSS